MNTQQQFIEHFDQYNWKYWGALTTTHDSDPFWLESLFHRWIRRLNVANQAKVQFLYVIEHTYVGRPHIHIQLGPMTLSITQMEALWVDTGGGKMSRIEPYDASKGSWYTVKDWLESDHKGIDVRGME